MALAAVLKDQSSHPQSPGHKLLVDLCLLLMQAPSIGISGYDGPEAPVVECLPVLILAIGGNRVIGTVSDDKA